MSSSERRICRLAQEVADTQDPLRALEMLAELRSEIEALTREQVTRGIRDGRSFSDLGRAMGISRQAAHRRYRALGAVHPEKRPRLTLTREARRLVSAASDEARLEKVRSEHVLIAVLRCGGDAAGVLERHGVTLSAVNNSLIITAPEVHPSAFARSRDGVRGILLEAARVAIARDEQAIDVDAVLLGALSNTGGGAGRVITALGVDLASIRSQLERKSEAPHRRPQLTPASRTRRGKAA